MLYGALEAGGTKMVLSVGNERNDLLERVSFPTETPEITVPRMLAWFRERNIAALGIGTFGPADLDPGSETYGWITSTPKTAWRDCPLLPLMRDGLHVPVVMDTDVNAAALAEYELGAAKGTRSCLYITVGTGIGGGVVIGGKPVHGLMHPEVGHMLLQTVPSDPSPEGFCPYHRGCAEGLASGPAIEKRWGKPASELPPDHPGWALEADYLARLCMNAVCAFSPEIIVLGGGVMHQKHLFPMIRSRLQALLNGYIPVSRITEEIDAYIVPAGLGDNSGALGALLLARSGV